MKGRATKGGELPPKGQLVIRVGEEEEKQQRFVVPLSYLAHPLFVGLLKEAEEVYGFNHNGAIAIPCHVEQFRRVQRIIDRDNNHGGSSVAPSYHHPLHLCFRA